jgi:sugar phosphate permease
VSVRSLARASAGAELTLAVSGKLAAAFGSVGLASLTPFVRDEFDLSAFGVGGMMGLIFVGAILATVPGGRLTDRVPPGRMLGGCLLVQAASLVVVATAPSTAVFFLGVGLAGLAMGAGDPATNVLVSTNVARSRRGLLMGVKQTGFTVGGLVAGLALPSVAEAGDWRLALLVPLATCVAVGLAGLRIAGAALAAPPGPKQEPEPVRAASLARMGVYGFFMAGIQLSVLGLLAVYVVDRVGHSARGAGLAIAITMAGGTTGRIAWGIVSDRLLRSRVVALQLAALGAGVALVALAVLGSSAALWPVLFVLGFCAIGWNTVYITVAAESVPPASVGRATGAALFFSYAGALVVPPLLGVLVDGTDSWAAAWLAAAGAAGVGLAVSTRVASTGGARSEQAESVAFTE